MTPLSSGFPDWEEERVGESPTHTEAHVSVGTHALTRMPLYTHPHTPAHALTHTAGC